MVFPKLEYTLKHNLSEFHNQGFLNAFHTKLILILLQIEINVQKKKLNRI